MAPPVAPKPKLLPFHDPNFSWETFESFFCDFLAAHPELVGKDGTAVRVISAHPYGRRGDTQRGIDIRAEMSTGEVWVFQCKHYKEWGPKDTSTAIAECGYDADRKFLLVTRAVSPESREIIAKYPEWELWDAGDISREFLQRLPVADAARILYTNFGRGWPEELLGISGSAPLVTAEAKFAPLLEPNRSFHHRLAMVGRREWLTLLDAFIEAKDARVFLLIGRGGLGKSRLLYEWSREFAQRHKGWTLRFVSDSPADFAAALDGTSKPLVLVFDDAHRFDEVRRALFGHLPARKDVKLVLALRPGPIDQIEAELVGSGFDTAQISRPDQMKRLSSEQALQLAESALGPELADRYRLAVRSLSRDVPLLAVLAAELLKRGELAEKDLAHTDAFRIRVFEGLLQEARPVEDRFGATRTRDFLRLLAVLAPVKVDAEFLTRAAAVLGGDTKPNHVTDILSALDQAGLLLTTGAGVRVSPDLLSDHLAYAACYDSRGRDTTFAERVMAHFPPNEFPRLMQHLAEAEWRACQENDSADSVVEPLWRVFVEQFEASSFYMRVEKLKAWANIAHLQPQRTLRLAELALRLDTAPKDKYARMWYRKWDTHSHVFEGLPSLLKPLAEHHQEFVAPCLEILWQIGRDLPPPPFNSQGHPITKIGEIAKFQIWKILNIQDEVLSWIERLLSGNDWTNRGNKPGWLLTQILNPFFATGLEDNWMTGNTFHWRTVPINLDKTARYRDRVLAALRAVAKRGDAALTLAAMNVLEHAMQRAYLGPSTIPATFSERWLAERKKALAVLAEIIRDSSSPVIHFRARRILLRSMQYDDPQFRAACREVYATIPDCFDFRIVRAAVGSYWDEFEGSKRDDWQDQAKHRWDQFIRSTAEALTVDRPTPEALLSYLTDTHWELIALGFQPNFWPILRSIGDTKPDVARELAILLIAQPMNPLGRLLDALVMPITANDTESRLKFCEDAIAKGDESRFGAMICFATWRQEGGLPRRGWDLINKCAATASPVVAEAILRFVSFNQRTPDTADWHLLAALPVTSEHWWIAHRVLESAADLLEKSILPDPEVADEILKKLDVLHSIGDPQIEHAIAEFAKHFPGKVFLAMWRRRQRREKEDSDFDVVPFDFHSIRFADVRDDPEAKSVINELEHRMLNGGKLDYGDIEILHIAVLQTASDAEKNLQRLLGKAKTKEQLERMAEFITCWHSWAVVLSCPDFTRELLLRAKATGQDFHHKISRRATGITWPPWIERLRTEC